MLVSVVFASIAAFGPGCGGAEQRSAHEPSLPAVYSELDGLFHRYYPNVASQASADAIHFEYNTRVFLIHEPLRTGEWQDAREVRGPNRGGILCHAELRKGRYAGAAAVPQTFDKRYFQLSVFAPYSAIRDEHLYVHLYHPGDVKTDFLEEFSRIVAGFASAAPAPPAR